MSARLLAVCAVVLAGAPVLAVTARAQEPAVRVAATVSPRSGQVGDVVQVDITVTTAGPPPDAISLPPLPGGLRLTGSSDFTEYEFRLPGGRRRTTRRQLTIATVAPGHYVIAPIAVNVAGQVYRTRPLRLDVSGTAAARPAGVEGITANGPDDEVLLQSWATPDTVYVGQQVTLRADALFSIDMRSRLASVPQYEAPSAPGFWVYDLPGANTTQLRPVHGQVYEVQTFRRAFFPLSPGHLFLPGARLSYSVRRGFLNGPETHELRGDSFPVLVRPLPARGQPDDFSGAVGHYSASARVEPQHVGAGEATTLTVEISGEGNIKALAPPRLPALAGVQVFSPGEDADLRPDAEAVGGTERFSWVLVPTRPGPLVIPALELPYFDPSQRRYEVAQTDSLELSVGPASGRAPSSSGRLETALRPLRERDAGPGAARWVRSSAFLALQTLPLIAFLGIVLERRRRRTRAARRPRGGPGMLERLRAELAELRARGAASAPLLPGEAFPPATGQAEAALPDDLLRFLRTWLAERLGVEELATTSAGRLDPALRRAGVRATVSAGLGTLAARLEQARFRPHPPGRLECLGWVDEAERLLTEVHGGGAGKSRNGAGRSSLPLLLALGGTLGLLAGTPGPASAQSAQAAEPVVAGSEAGAQGAEFRPGEAARSPFERGVAAYHMGDFSRAADIFGAFAATNPTHATAWYDLGNAAFRAGERGRAIWAWLRALELLPRDVDTRQNLALAGADPQMVDAATPPVAASVDELLLLAGLLWLLGTAVLLWRRVRPSRTATTAGWVAVLLAATAAGLAGASRLGPARAVALRSTTLLGAPKLHADSLGFVGEGGMVRVLERRAGWSHVRPGSASAQDGWVPDERLGPL